MFLGYSNLHHLIPTRTFSNFLPNIHPTLLFQLASLYRNFEKHYKPIFFAQKIIGFKKVLFKKENLEYYILVCIYILCSIHVLGVIQPVMCLLIFKKLPALFPCAPFFILEILPTCTFIYLFRKFYQPVLLFG